MVPLTLDMSILLGQLPMFPPYFVRNNLINSNPLCITSHPCRPINKYQHILIKPMLSHYQHLVNPMFRGNNTHIPCWGSLLMQSLKNWPRITLFDIRKRNHWNPINLEHLGTKIMNIANFIMSKDTLPLNACILRILYRTSLTGRGSQWGHNPDPMQD